MRHLPNQIIWDAMSVSGTASLPFFQRGTTMPDALYVKMSCDKVVTHMQVHRCTIFMHDVTPCHRSEAVQDLPAEEQHTCA